MLHSGLTLEEAFTKAELGTNILDFSFFPLLIKFIDAKSNLSFQVHPSDDYALTHENSLGKTEMWYIVEADEGAGIYLGSNRDVTLEEYERAIKKNTLTELHQFEIDNYANNNLQTILTLLVFLFKLLQCNRKTLLVKSQVRNQ